MVKCNSNPGLLNTIKVPRDMAQLKGLLPQKRYKDKAQPNAKENLPGISRDISVSQISEANSKL